MAEGTSVETTTTSTEEVDRELCAVCLEPYVHPAKLPCGHVFCFLCIKGTANRSKRCAMCRQEIPNDFVDKPTLVSNRIDDITLEGNYQWYYEGRNGWWQYDERTSKELEMAYKNGERTCELLVAGFLYVMDLEAMLQLRRNDPSRRRRIKRDSASIDKIGIAGLRCTQQCGNVLPGNSKSTEHVTHAESTTLDTPNTEADTDTEVLEIDSQSTIVCDSPLNFITFNASSDTEEY